MNPPDGTEGSSHTLRNFPFADLATFKQELRQPGHIRLSADIGVALEFAGSSRAKAYVPGRVRLAILFWSGLPYLAVICYIVYIIIIRRWLFLLSLPAFLAASQLYHPRTAAMLGPLRTVAIAATLTGLGASLVVGNRGFIAASVVLVVEWLSLWLTYKVAVDAFLSAVETNDELLERSWNNGLVGIWLADGTKHWVDRKFESGRFVQLD